MAKIHVDGKEYEVEGSKNLLEACLELGLDIPYFCWHPALGSVGSCRQCAVKQYKDKDDTMGRLVMSCMTPATNDVYIAIKDEEAVEFRASVIEWLMTNHPHDCPVCEEGGNCHLQDMTVMSGHNKRSYRFTKRTHNNQELGPFVAHEMNRCIACYRCVRYYRDYADGTDFGVYGAHNNLYFGRIEDGVLENEFSGNLVEVCPTGVFTDKTHSERYNRKWDMQFAPSICQQCSVGCNTSPGERYGELRRIENRFNGDVNHYFLCDRGRFGYGYVNNKDRPRQPMLKQHGEQVRLNKKQAVKATKAILSYAKGVVAIGSPRASLESNLMLRELVGEANFFSGIRASELEQLRLMQHILKNGGIHTPSVTEIEQYDAVLILGEDITQTAARIALAVRQALKAKRKVIAAELNVSDWMAAAVDQAGQNARYPLFITSVNKTRLSDVAQWEYLASVDEQVDLAYQVAHQIDHMAPQSEHAVEDQALLTEIQQIATQLQHAKRPLIIAGTGSEDKRLIEAAYNIANALKQRGTTQVGLTFVAQESNSMGLALLESKSVEQGLKSLTHGAADTLIVLENDLYRRVSRDVVDAAVEKAENIIVLDHQQHELTAKADLLLSSASFAEADGTLINQEGRVQRFFQVFDPTLYDKKQLSPSGQPLAEDANLLEHKAILPESWRWLAAVNSTLNATHNKINWSTLDEVIDKMVTVCPELTAVRDTAPNAAFQIKGMKLAREPARYSGRTAMLANISVHEPAQPKDLDTPFRFSMEGYSGATFAQQQVPFAWAPGWNSPQAWNKFQTELGRKVKGGNPGVRLFEANDEQPIEYFSYTAATAKPSGFQVVTCYHLFGSDEMSQRAEPIVQRTPQPYLLINHLEASRLGLIEGQRVSCECQGEQLNLPIKLSEHLAKGVIGLPLGLPNLSPALVGSMVENLRGAQ